jgi:hypothetical protein
MKELSALQNKFQEHLLNATSDIFSEIVETENVPTEVRLSIYSNAYRLRLIEALATNFPVLQIYLGDEQFETLATEYINAHPSPYRSIRWFGDGLENFMKTHSPYSDYLYLAELARVEWEMTLVFDAEDSSVASIDILSTIPPAAWINMRLVAHPSVRHLDLFWNIVSIWDKLSEEETPPELIRNEKAQTWLFWRHELVNHYAVLETDEACAIKVILKGSSFGEMCAALCESLDEETVPMRAAALVRDWITAGLISTIEY